MRETGLSPEDLGARFGVSGMTIRRWCRQGKNKSIPIRHERSIVEGIYQLIVEEKLDANSPIAVSILSKNSPLSFRAALKGLGCSGTDLSSGKHHERVTSLLSQIGESSEHKNFVTRNLRAISKFKSNGADWKTRLNKLLAVTRSPRLRGIDKVIAYGALFYLLTPFDLVPDHLPVVGLIDDFGILGAAVSYYAARFPNLFS